jgi:hypothetical protein
MGKCPMNQDFITLIVPIFPMCPFLQQGVHPDLCIRYHTVNEIEPVN